MGSIFRDLLPRANPWVRRARRWRRWTAGARSWVACARPGPSRSAWAWRCWRRAWRSSASASTPSARPAAARWSPRRSARALRGSRHAPPAPCRHLSRQSGAALRLRGGQGCLRSRAGAGRARNRPSRVAAHASFLCARRVRRPRGRLPGAGVVTTALPMSSLQAAPGDHCAAVADLGVVRAAKAGRRGRGQRRQRPRRARRGRRAGHDLVRARGRGLLRPGGLSPASASCFA